MNIYLEMYQCKIKVADYTGKTLVSILNEDLTNDLSLFTFSNSWRACSPVTSRSYGCGVINKIDPETRRQN